MRKFIISDIHGLGNFYYSVMNYLDNINKEEDVILYINGDLIDRGLDSAEILLDIKKRIEENKFQIKYLGGNHELMMYEEFKRRKKGIVNDFNDWFIYGGYITYDCLSDLLDDDKNKMLEVVNFISNLDIYHKFDEKINDKNIVLVHASCPLKVNDICNIKLKDINDDTSYYLWAREDDPYMPFRCRIGSKDYFSIVGHTPNNSKYGYQYHKNGNYLNIDGGCAVYASGYFNCEHFPLVEVFDNYLKILTFNSNNEIMYGNYFNGESILFSDEELEKERSFLNHNLKVKKLIKNEDGVVYYEEDSKRK